MPLFRGSGSCLVMCVYAKIFREPVNAISHGAGAVGSVFALTLMVVFAALKAEIWHVVSFSVFGASLILMYTSSFLYHALKISEKALAVFRRIDHIMIFHGDCRLIYPVVSGAVERTLGVEPFWYGLGELPWRVSS